jgi:thiol-disulfide isomerase/thioredoxin
VCKKAAQIFAVLLACAALSNAVQAKIYRWVDEGGKVHFSDRPSRAHSSEQVKLQINTYEAVTYDTSSIDVGNKRVVMYSASWCGVCKRAKRYFAQKNIKLKFLIFVTPQAA